MWRSLIFFRDPDHVGVAATLLERFPVALLVDTSALDHVFIFEYNLTCEFIFRCSVATDPLLFRGSDIKMAVGSVVERFLDTEEVTGSNPVPPIALYSFYLINSASFLSDGLFSPKERAENARNNSRYYPRLLHLSRRRRETACLANGTHPRAHRPP
jgi:hypothetical protein